MVAGFGSWAMSAVNPAAQVVSALKQQHQDNYDLRCVEVLVDSETLYGRIEKALQEYQPDIWIGVGVAVDSPAIRIEGVGINVRSFDVPDNSGLRLKPTSVVENAPLAYPSNLPNEKIVYNLRSSGIPAVLSFHAGTHLCNQMLYSVLHLSRKMGLDLISGFVHVPQSTDNVALSAGRESNCSSMSMPMMTQAIELTVECAVQQFNEQSRLA